MELVGIAMRWAFLVAEEASVPWACLLFLVRSVMTRCAPMLTFTILEPRTISRVLEAR